jgi:ribonucleoside-diphosphate reductase beta chain
LDAKPRPPAPASTRRIRKITRSTASTGGHAKNHDFFSGSGSSYVIGKAEATEDEDWDF